MTWLPTITSEGSGAEATLPNTQSEEGHTYDNALSETQAAMHDTDNTAQTSSLVVAH